MTGEEKRRSERVIPFLSDEEVVLVHSGGREPLLAKMLDLSDVGTLVYMLTDDELPALGSTCPLSLYHEGKVFQVPAQIVRKSGRLAGFEFGSASSEVMQHIQEKLIRMEVEWIRLSRRG
ncbi:MAG: PilZ domain-containing protein [Acidobacteria bacterium]|nr:PilZ domain-containing protein [Acidobacteriota bacterium]